MLRHSSCGEAADTTRVPPEGPALYVGLRAGNSEPGLVAEPDARIGTAGQILLSADAGTLMACSSAWRPLSRRVLGPPNNMP